MRRKPRTVSLYSGAGGLDYGFHKAGFRTIFANDIDPWAVETFGRLLGSDVAQAGDIDDLDLPEASEVDVVIGGPPCQGFSVAGKMDPLDDRSRHVWKFLEVVSELRPEVFVMENVKALARNERWATTREGLIRAAQAMGYSTKLFVLNASDYGVPQSRERMFLIGSLSAVPTGPVETTKNKPPASREVFDSLPKPGSPGNDLLATAKITLATNPVLRSSCFAGMLFNGAGRPMNLDAPALTLPASMGGNKTPIVDQKWLEHGGSNHWVKRYHRHLWNGGESWAADAAPDYLRRITAQEAALLQSFPEDLEWAGSPSVIFRQIGNAVPPKMAQEVAKSVLKLLDGKKAPAKTRRSPMTVEELVVLGTEPLALA